MHDPLAGQTPEEYHQKSGVFHQLIIQHFGYNNYENFYVILGPLINLINIT